MGDRAIPVGVIAGLGRVLDKTGISDELGQILFGHLLSGKLMHEIVQLVEAGILLAELFQDPVGARLNQGQ